MHDDTGEDGFERGLALQRAGRFGEAVEVYRRLAATVLTVNLAINLGVCLTELGEREGAEHYLGLTARQRPDDGNVRRLLAAAYGESGRTELAERELRAALAANPGDKAAELALGGLYLSLGRYAEGWPLMAARAGLHPAVVPPVMLDVPEWRGEPLAGKSVLVWVEQGFGDQIQMARFANSLKVRGAAGVTLGCRPALAHLFSTLAGVDAVIPIAVGAAVQVETHDYWSRYFSLPEPLGLTLETLPAQTYLSAPADRRARWAREGGGARVGLVWQASPTGFNAANKGLPRDLAQRVLDAGAISLQPEDSGAQDFADTAAIIENLDLVISIDTAVAHLAGAMGKPCWTLLPYVRCDWRWLRDRADSPWYPTMRLYRQAQARDWSGTVDDLLRDLAAAGLRAA
jgi:glycosyl transferase family 9 (putative heptosyltransferase)/tetratricopeptide repeat protein